MFFQAEGEEGKSLKGAYENFKNSLKGLSDEMLAFDVQAKKVVGDTFGQGREFSDAIRRNLGAAVRNTAELGYTTTQYATLLTNISTSLQTNVSLSTKQLENFMLFSDVAGISAEETGKLVAGFQNIGVSIGGALSEMEGLAETAREYGINVGQYMGVIGENLKLMNQFKFQGGVEGLANMVAKSQALRINLTTVTSLAEKFLDPDAAIGAAASLQMMGGELAQLGDGFQLMNLAQNDVEGLFDSIVEATAASASFNEETGQFELSALEMRRLRATAKELGVEYDELSKGALNYAARQEKLSQLDFMPDIKEEDKEFLASIGQLDESGELKIAVERTNKEGKAEMQLVKATELSAKELENLRLSDEDGKKNMEAIAREQRDLLEKIYDEGVAARKIALGDAIAGESETFTKFRDNIEKLGGTFMEMTKNALKDGSLLRTGTAALTEEMVTAAEKFNNGAGVFADAITDFQSFVNRLRSGGTTGGFSAEESFANDLVSLPGYGGRVLSGPEGSISLNDDDTIIAGTDLFPNEQRRRNTSQLMGNLPQDVSNMLNNLGSSESPNISFEDLQITHSGTIRLEGDGRFLTLDMLANNPQMLENLTNMIKQRMSSQTMGYNNA
jgi:hypothetical protein